MTHPFSRILKTAAYTFAVVVLALVVPHGASASVQIWSGTHDDYTTQYWNTLQADASANGGVWISPGFLSSTNSGFRLFGATSNWITYTTLDRACSYIYPSTHYSYDWGAVTADNNWHGANSQGQVVLFNGTSWYTESANNSSGCPGGGDSCHYGLGTLYCSTDALPNQQFSANPTTITQGGSATLTWDDSPAVDPTSSQTSCSATGFSNSGFTSSTVCADWQTFCDPFSGTCGTWCDAWQVVSVPSEIKQGSVQVSPSTTTTYTYSCTSPNGTTVRSATVNVVPATAPDLTAAAGNPITTNAGSPVTLSATVINQGNAGTGAGFHNLWQVTLSDQASVVDNENSDVGALGPGASQGVSHATSYTFNSTGTYYYRLCADNNFAVGGGWAGSINESNEGNNCSGWQSITVNNAPPDLTASVGGAVNGIAGATKTFAGTVQNNGGPTPAGFQNLLQICNDTSCSGYQNLKQQTLGVLGGGASAGLSLGVALPSTAGSYVYRWCANRDTSWNPSFSESNPNNNCSGWQTLTVYSPITTTCSVLPASGQIFPTPTNFTWTAYPAGGSGSYSSYAWSSGGKTGSGNPWGTTYSAPGTYGATVTVTDSAGNSSGSLSCNAQASVTRCGTAVPTISASQSIVNKGTQVTFTWSSTGVNSSCTITGSDGFSETDTPTGNSCQVSTSNHDATINTQTVYKITCDGTHTATAVVNVNPAFKEF